jgi:hypothetical protein
MFQLYQLVCIVLNIMLFFIYFELEIGLKILLNNNGNNGFELVQLTHLRHTAIVIKISNHRTEIK